MEEEKKNVQNGQNGQGGRNRRRRHRHHKGNGGAQAQGGQNQSAPVAQQTATPEGQKQGNQPQKGQPQAQKQPQKGQPQKPQQKPQQSVQQKAQNQPPKKKEERKNQANNAQDNRKDTYVYVVDGNLYINLTNKCCNGCDFCVRNERTSYYGNYLWLRHGEPTAQQVIAALNGMGDLKRFKEGVFCGFGEPTYRMAEMLAVCDYLHEKGLQTRLNTNGQGNLINKRDIVPEMKGKIDFVNVSLNASCAEKYQPMCRSQFGTAGFDGMIEFAKLCKKNSIPCRFSIVDCIGEEEVAACQCLADSVSIPLYVRKYIQDS
ncbi:MAG: TatD family nuclease-associated radical SAM protein [Clostridia bacterium]|nr:TatD family nuclease-associated radical SAM protein [Clostridia bacterium]